MKDWKREGKKDKDFAVGNFSPETTSFSETAEFQINSSLTTRRESGALLGLESEFFHFVEKGFSGDAK